MEIRNDSGELINHFELDEQYLAKHFVNKNDMKWGVVVEHNNWRFTGRTSYL